MKENDEPAMFATTGIDGTIVRFRDTENHNNGGRLRPTSDQAGTVLCIKEL